MASHRGGALLIAAAATSLLVVAGALYLSQRERGRKEREKQERQRAQELEDTKNDKDTIAVTETNQQSSLSSEDSDNGNGGENPNYLSNSDMGVGMDMDTLPPIQEISILEGGEQEGAANDKKRILSRGTITIAHGSVTGTCAALAQTFYDALVQQYPSIESKLQLGKMEEWDWWDEFLNNEQENDQQESESAPPIVVWILPTYTGGTWTPSSTCLQQSLQDLENDWRIDKKPLKATNLHVAVFGMGSSAYNDTSMGRPAREAWGRSRKLGAQTIGSVGLGDDSVGDHTVPFEKWMQTVISKLVLVSGANDKDASKAAAASSSCGCKQDSTQESTSSTCCQSEKPSPNDEEKKDDDEVEVDYGDYPSSSEDEDDEEEPQVMDLEDMGNELKPKKPSNVIPEMVTPSQAKALKKEGYKLIGTHSAVKLCRWTKHQLRGRGGCYKHTFYGITSYQCMEATPSLACANKCVFCWRHHKNPVAKEWKWKTDDPYTIVDEACKMHIQMIKETKGIPGVRMDRWKEAHTVAHCALSLVGEPIMYPRIDELLGDLHDRKISTFLVTNGQHPDAIEKIRPITQLYVSVDAPTEESLIAIDRPLFNDAWDRLKISLSALKLKGQRTVARITVVKGWNSDEVEGYAKLIALGKVSLVEVKGVTFCGKSDASNLNMSNTPWHHEVSALTIELKEALAKLRAASGNDDVPEYGLACEHKHSVSVLLARVDQFAVDDPVTGERKCKTWIDYDKFHKLAMQYKKDPTFTFGVKDYIADTPDWALYGATEEGFDPTELRHRKAKKHPKYTKFDQHGVPTHDDNDEVLDVKERKRLTKIMNNKMFQVGTGTTVTELKGGEKVIQDASLMFRGLTVIK